MAEQDTLLQAILDHPDASGPRLAYADWCDIQPEESVMARAEFIRAQITVVELGGSYQHEIRSEKLWNQYGAIWAAPIAGMVQKYGFDRGFVGFIRISARNFMEYAERLFASAPIRHVDFTGVRDVDETLFASPFLGRLLSLSMDDCGLYDIHLRMLAAAPAVSHLGWLSVMNNRLDLDGIGALAASPYLKELRFADFRGNTTDPGERLAMDSGTVVDSWLPDTGQELERRYGPLPWLRRDAERSRFAVPGLHS